MGSGYSKMKKQMKQMQKQMEENQEKLKTMREVGSAGNGLVKITLSGEKKVIDVSIHPDCVEKDDIEGLQDLIISAFNEACSKVESHGSII